MLETKLPVKSDGQLLLKEKKHKNCCPAQEYVLSLQACHRLHKPGPAAPTPEPWLCGCHRKNPERALGSTLALCIADVLKGSLEN